MYPLKTADAKTAEKILTTLFPPPAKIVVDPGTDQVHVQAGATVQKAVKQVVEQMQSPTPSEKKPRLELYAIGDNRGPQVIEQLKVMVPEAKLTWDAKEEQLAAFAVPPDHEVIKSFVGKLTGPFGHVTTRQFEVYALTKADPTQIIPLLQSLFPNAKFGVDAVSKYLAVIAVPADQAAIKGLLGELQPEKPGPNTPELRFYLLQRVPAATLVKALEGVAPKAQVMPDASNAKRLMVVAIAPDHELIQRTIDKYEKATPRRRRAHWSNTL